LVVLKLLISLCKKMKPIMYLLFSLFYKSKLFTIGLDPVKIPSFKVNKWNFFLCGVWRTSLHWMKNECLLTYAWMILCTFFFDKWSYVLNILKFWINMWYLSHLYSYFYSCMITMF
jgi:hypothetical protein